MEEPILPLHILNQIDRRWQVLLSRQAAQSKLAGFGMRRLADMGRPAKKSHRPKPKRRESRP
ncbi:MAG TPA: hypothetical protein VF957_18285 [Bradyrhizobium sp.]